MKLEDLPDVLTAAEVAIIFRCSRETVRRKTEDGIFERIEGFHDLLYRKTHILELLGYRTPRPEDGDDHSPACAG